jgi:pimeloyl-ACP methyl ester carboxylesterase
VRLSLRAAPLAPRFLAGRLEAWGRKPTPPTGHPDTDAAYLRGRIESFRDGGMWLVRELGVLGRPWGFSLADVQAPVTLWYGESDTVCPPAIGRDFAARLPRATLKLVPGTHQVIFPRWREILADAGSG